MCWTSWSLRRSITDRHECTEKFRDRAKHRLNVASKDTVLFCIPRAGVSSLRAYQFKTSSANRVEFNESSASRLQTNATTLVGNVISFRCTERTALFWAHVEELRVVTDSWIHHGSHILSLKRKINLEQRGYLVRKRIIFHETTAFFRAQGFFWSTPALTWWLPIYSPARAFQLSRSIVGIRPSKKCGS